MHEGPVRFERPVILGRGARGVVYRVRDRQLARDVALKRMHAFDSDARVRFKREFRAIEGLRHPNLVRMLELGDDGEPYLLMELVEGGDLRAHLARHGRAAVLDVLPGLLDGLHHLHAHGIVHRDLKPENVLVSSVGEPKLCDFGLLAAGDDAPGVLAGTPLYMSPEQARGAAPSPQSDLYALGVMLFEAVSGAPPFRGSRDEVLRAHLGVEAPALAPLPEWAPEPAARAIARLLEKDPAARGTLDDVHEAFLGARRSRAVPPRPRDVVGRGPLLARIRASSSDPPCAVAIEGPSGIGKSTVLRALVSTLATEGALVLSSRARTTERVAFNVMDGIVDGVAMELARSRDELVEPIEPELALAASAFPVLALTPRTMRERDRALIEQRLFGARPTPRSEAFTALARILGALAQARPVVIVLDDFQWADEDSLALLSRMRELQAPIALIVALRDEDARAHEWLADEGVATIPVGPLDSASLREIAERTLGGHTLSSPELDEICARAAGRPLLAQIYARAHEPGTATLEGALRRLLVRLAPSARGLLALLAVSEAWVPLDRLARMCGVDGATTLDRARELAALGLVQESRASSGRIRLAIAHDSIRAAANELATSQERVRAHLAFVAAVESEVPLPLEVLVHHLLGAGRTEDAARYARVAATAARERAAFGLAADMLAVAIAARDGDGAALRRRRAEDLEHAGRFLEAAGAWRELADLGEGEPTALELARAHALIAANRTREGLQCLDTALARAGESGTLSSGLRGLGAGVRFLIGPLPARIERRLSRARPLAEGLRAAKLGVLLGFLDPLVGMRFLQHARQTFLALDDAEQLAIIESFLAVLAHVASPSREVPALAARWAASAASRVEVPSTPEARGMPYFLAGLTAMRAGRWEASKAAFGEAAAIFARAAGTTELMMACSWRMMGDVYSQDLPAMRRHLAWFDRQLRRVGDGIIAAHVELARGYTETLQGDFERSRATIQALADMFGPERPNVQRAAALLYLHIPDSYQGDPRAARARFASSLAAARPHRFLHTLFAAPFAAIGAMLEANALRVGDRGASHARLERFARVVRTAPPLMAGMGARALAYAADARDRPDEAVVLLRGAEAEASRFGRRIDVAIARAQLGRRLGGGEGRALVADAEAILREQRASPLLLDEDAGLR